MPSKNSDGLGLLVRKDPLTQSDWMGLIGARRELIKPFLGKISLRTLGDVGVLSGEDGKVHSLKEECPRNMSDIANPLSIQGLFERVRWEDQGEGKAIVPIWGLSRCGDVWICAEARIIKHHTWWRAKELMVRYTERISDILTVCGLEPLEVWNKLGNFIKVITGERLRLYEEIKHLSDIILAEEATMSLVPASKEVGKSS